MPPFDIAIAGEVNLDLILYGLPEALPVDREILGANFDMTLGSSSAILAHNLSVLGAGVAFIARHGSDDMGRIAMERLVEGGVDVSRCVQGGRDSKTGVTVLLAHERSRHILTCPGVTFDLSLADIDIPYVASARHFHLSSLFLLRRLHPDLPALLRDLKGRGMTVSLDTNDDPEDRWDGVLHEILPLVDVLLPNDDEIRRMARRDTVEEALSFLSGTVPLIAVKCGARGALVQQGSRRIEVPGLTVKPVDTIGAGDSFNAGFLRLWLQGADAETCARAGNITGALSTQRAGGTEAFRDREFVTAFLRQHQFPGASL